MTHIVARGETLARIAVAHGSTVAAFMAANPQLTNPDHISPGQPLEIPGTAAGPGAGTALDPGGGDATGTSVFVVGSGDTMKLIASKFDLTLTELIAANPQIPNPDVLSWGQEIVIPAGASVAPSPPTLHAGELPAEPAPRTKRTWSEVPVEQRMLHVMTGLVDYGYPPRGAAGIVGNLFVESGLLPDRLQGSSPTTPMRAKDFAGETVDFSPREVMKRSRRRQRGPALAGVGLAQWTWKTRRKGLFLHEFNGKALGAKILFNMNAQIDYLVSELGSTYQELDLVLRDREVTIDEATDHVLYDFEVPGSISRDGRKLPMADPAVQAVAAARRPHAHAAHAVFTAAEPG